MQKEVDEPPRPVSTETQPSSPKRAENCARCGKPLGSTTHTTSTGVVCHTCHHELDIEWAGVLEFRISDASLDEDADDEFGCPIESVTAAGWVDGTLTQVALEAGGRVDGEPKANSAFDRVGICSHREWIEGDGLADEFGMLFEIFAMPGGEWMAVDRLEEFDGGETA